MKTMRVKTWLAVLAVALCGGEAWRIHRQDVAHEREIAALRAEMRAWRDELGAAVPPGAAPVRIVVAAGAPADPHGPETPPAAAAVATAPPELAAPDAETRRATWLVEQVQRFDAQADDARWSRPTEARLGPALGAFLPPGSAVRSLACRGTTCRVEVQHPDEDAAEAFVDGAMTGEHKVWRGPMHVRRESAADGSVVTVAYLDRDDEEAPL